MDPTPSPCLLPPARRVPYPQVTPVQLALALADATQRLRDHFPTLSFATWSARLQQLQPALWVESEQRVYLDEEDLACLVQRLATAAELPDLSPVIYCDQAVYLARRLVNFEKQAIQALAELEADPRAPGGGVCDLVFDLATGNGIAHEVYRRTQRPESPRPGQPDLDTLRRAVPARISAVRVARGARITPLPFPADLPPAEAA